MRRSRRRWLAVLAGVLAVALTATVGIALWLRKVPEPPLAAACAVPTLRPRGSAIAGPVDGLRVVESGFTQTGGGTGQGLSMGAILENTTTQVAYRVFVHFAYFDAQHVPAHYSDEDANHDVHVPVIMPGQQIGVGNYGFVREVSERPFRQARVATLEVTIRSIQGWAPADARSFAAVPTTHNGTVATGRLVGYTVTSPYCTSVTSRGVAFIYRDSASTLIGGDVSQPNYEDCEPGQKDSSASVDMVPDGFDDSRTEEYAYCDPTS